MNKLLPLIALMFLSACATQDELVTQDVEQAVRDFIEVRELPEAQQMRTSNSDSWDQLDQNFILYEARNQFYLVEFIRRCYELDQYPIVPDERRNANTVNARFDTIRGCRIDKLFPLQEGEVEELKAIGESPGSRN